METTFAKGQMIRITLGGDCLFLFPRVFEKDEKDYNYKLCVLIPKSNVKAIETFEAAVDEAIARGYSGELKPKSTFPKKYPESKLKLPLKDWLDKVNAEGEHDSTYDDYMVFNCRSGYQPKVLDANGQQILDPNEFRTGASGAVSVTMAPFNYENQSYGVSVYLNHVLQLKESTFEGGGYGGDPETDFAAYLPAAKAARPISRGRVRPSATGSPAEADAEFRARNRSRTYSDGSDDPMLD